MNLGGGGGTCMFGFQLEDCKSMFEPKSDFRFPF